MRLIYNFRSNSFSGGGRETQFWPIAFLTYCAFLFSFHFLYATPQNQSQGIAAIVNKSILTHKDVDDRVNLIKITAPETLTQEQERKLRAAVLKNMIDEILQIQEAASRMVTVEEAEVIEALTNIEKTNGMAPGQLPTFLKKKGVPVSTLRDQVYANLLWARYIAEGYGETTGILENEVDENYERILSQSDVGSVHAYEIVLSIDAPSEKEAVLSQAQSIASSLRGGANFAALAREFSQAPSAAKGGDLGWVSAGQYEEPLNSALFSLPLKKVSDPIITPTAIYLFWISDKKVNESAGERAVDLAQVGISLFLDRSPEALDEAKNRLEKIRSQAKSCQELDAVCKKYGASAIFTQNVLVDRLPAELKILVNKLSPNQSSSVFTTENGPSFVFVCNVHHITSSGQLPLSKDRLRESMRNYKLDLISRRVLKDLRRRAYIDLRS